MVGKVEGSADGLYVGDKLGAYEGARTTDTIGTLEYVTVTGDDASLLRRVVRALTRRGSKL